jgi:hypothetical protein
MGAFYRSSTLVKILFLDPISNFFKIPAFPFAPPFFGKIFPVDLQRLGPDLVFNNSPLRDLPPSGPFPQAVKFPFTLLFIQGGCVAIEGIRGSK